MASLETLDLLRRGSTMRASTNIALCAGAVALVHVIASRFIDNAVPIARAAIEEEG